MEIFNADAYKMVEKFIADGIKVDHIITDPPYNISKSNNFGTMNHPRTGVDFGNWDHGCFDLYSWIPKYSKLLKRNGSMIIFCSYLYMSYIIDVLNSEECGMNVKDIIVWQKSNPMPRNIDRRYVQDMEFAIWAVKKGAKWTFNRPADKPYLRALFTTSTVSGSERYAHPTQKSLKLMEDIIKIHTKPGDLIMDPFMGTGTTGVAAINLNRDFIGIELEKKYFKICQQRLHQGGDK